MWSKSVSEYRRFISYIYDYHDGKKRKNCGYVKVEIRNDICRMGVHMEAAAGAGREMQVYGFVRVDGKALGLRAGNAVRRGNAWELQLSTPAQNFAKSGYAIEDIKGVWLRSDQGGNFITVWDDEAVELDMFVTELPQPELLQPEVPQPEPEKKTAQAETAPRQRGMLQQRTLPQQGGILQQRTLPRQGEMPQAGHPESSLHVQETQEQNSGPETGGREVSQSLMQRWENFLYHYPQISPFDDEEFFQCICIAPKDLSFLPREERQFGGNPFLREGYENYGHLLLACHEQGRFVLAVPGLSGEMQDRHLARMCGFPLFKQAKDTRQAGTEEKDTGTFGYWYHFLNEECPANKKEI